MTGAPVSAASCAARSLSQDPMKKAARLVIVSSRAYRLRDGSISEAAAIQRSTTSSKREAEEALVITDTE